MNNFFFGVRILNWYNINKRDLPWRNTKNPYYIWISEVILQQTRVEQGKQYYLKFIESFPNIKSLASASEDETLKLWQGLGYYSRARNLHRGAKQIIELHNEIFPNKYAELLKISGIGSYTAAAIASIAFNIAVAAIDGNVYRVLSRVFEIDVPIDSNTGKKTFENLANKLIDKKQPGNYNQALMELGAIICKPRNPFCKNCPLQNNCLAYKNGRINTLPVKSKKVLVRKRYFYYLIINYKEWIYVKQRTENDIWKKLYDFPLIESPKDLPTKLITQSTDWINIFGQNYATLNHVSELVNHQLTHQKIYARFIQLTIKNEKYLPANFIKINKRDIFGLAVPKIIENYLKNGFFNE